jgi:CheY-like chemotaxis protein
MDGGELAERAKDLDPHLHVVLMAGLTDPHLDALVAGYQDLPFITKPVSFLGACQCAPRPSPLRAVYVGE